MIREFLRNYLTRGFPSQNPRNYWDTDLSQLYLWKYRFILRLVKKFNDIIDFKTFRRLKKEYICRVSKSSYTPVRLVSEREILNLFSRRIFYTVQMFHSLVKLAQQNRWDVLMLSGKYGLIPLGKIIHLYNQKIQTEQITIRSLL